MRVAPDTVLRTEQGHEIHVLGGVQNVDVRPQVVVHARRVGDQTDPQAFQHLEVLLLQNLYARLHFLCRDTAEDKSQGAADYR